MQLTLPVYMHKYHIAKLVNIAIVFAQLVTPALVFHFIILITWCGIKQIIMIAWLISSCKIVFRELEYQPT